jgi:hypothetical protein
MHHGKSSFERERQMRRMVSSLLAAVVGLGALVAVASLANTADDVHGCIAVYNDVGEVPPGSP